MYLAPKVKRNIFKTDEKKGTEEKALGVMEFPELDKREMTGGVAIPKEKEKEKSYMHIMACGEKAKEETKVGLEKGMCRLTWDDRRKLVIEISEDTNAKKEETKRKSYHEYVSKRMNALFQKWDDYKREFIELRGEDAYIGSLDEYQTEEEDFEEEGMGDEVMGDEVMYE
jgi:hypothetical protein